MIIDQNEILHIRTFNCVEYCFICIGPRIESGADDRQKFLCDGNELCFKVWTKAYAIAFKFNDVKSAFDYIKKTFPNNKVVIDIEK